MNMTSKGARGKSKKAWATRKRSHTGKETRKRPTGHQEAKPHRKGNQETTHETKSKKTSQETKTHSHQFDRCGLVLDGGAREHDGLHRDLQNLLAGEGRKGPDEDADVVPREPVKILKKNRATKKRKP